MKIYATLFLCLLIFACGQQEMSQSNLDLPTVQPVAASGSVIAAGAFTEVINVIEPIDFIQFVDCADGGAGEDVQLTGFIHTIIRTTINGNKIGIKTQTNPQGVSGIGLSSGDLYHGTGVTQETSNESVGGFPVTETFVNNFRIIGPGRGNNLLIHENAHVTVNANGTATVVFDHFSIECK